MQLRQCFRSNEHCILITQCHFILFLSSPAVGSPASQMKVGTSVFFIYSYQPSLHMRYPPCPDVTADIDNLPLRIIRSLVRPGMRRRRGTHLHNNSWYACYTPVLL